MTSCLKFRVCGLRNTAILREWLSRRQADSRVKFILFQLSKRLSVNIHTFYCLCRLKLRHKTDWDIHIAACCYTLHIVHQENPAMLNTSQNTKVTFHGYSAYIFYSRQNWKLCEQTELCDATALWVRHQPLMFQSGKHNEGRWQSLQLPEHTIAAFQWSRYLSFLHHIMCIQTQATYRISRRCVISAVRSTKYIILQTI